MNTTTIFILSIVPTLILICGVAALIIDESLKSKMKKEREEHTDFYKQVEELNKEPTYYNSMCAKKKLDRYND